MKTGRGSIFASDHLLASPLQVLEAMWGWGWLLAWPSCSLLLWELWLPAGCTAILSELCSQLLASDIQ